MAERQIVYVLRTLADPNLLIGLDGGMVTPDNWRSALKIACSEHAALANSGNRVLIGYLISLEDNDG